VKPGRRNGKLYQCWSSTDHTLSQGHFLRRRSSKSQN